MSTPDLTTAYFTKLLYSLNAVNLPVSTSQINVADGKGGFQWLNVFDVISTQGALEGFPINHLPSTLYELSNASQTGPTGVAAGLFSWIGNGLNIVSPSFIQKPTTAVQAWDANAYSVQGFRLGAFTTFQTAQTSTDCMMGFSESPQTAPSFSNIRVNYY